MNFGKRTIVAALFALAFGGVAAAQSFDPTAYYVGFSAMHPADGRSVTVSFSMLSVRHPRVPNAPVYGELVEHMTRAKADGTQFTNTTYPIKFWRNSEGSFRVERVIFSGTDDTSGPLSTIVAICDHTAGLMYVLDMQHHIAHRFPCQSPISLARPDAQRPPTSSAPLTAPHPNVVASPPPDPSRPERKSESLGEQVIGEVVAQGSRITTTYPIGYEGNDRPIVVSNETWVSRDLKLEIMRKFIDPHIGMNLREMTNIRRAEPDAALFQVPSDFAIVDEPAGFKFTLVKGGS
jgi:hypothetical protein